MKEKKSTLAAAKVRGMTDEEIGIELRRQRDALFGLRTQTVTEKIEDPSRFAKTRRNIARLATERSARRAKKAAGK